MKWREEEYQMLILAMEKGGTSSGVIDLSQEYTKRSRKSVIRKLTKMGFLNSLGVGYKKSLGFIKR